MLLLTKAVFAIMIGFLSSIVLGLIMLPLLKKLRVGQKISIFVGEAHRKKEGTPTMGGLIFIIPTIVATLGLIFTGRVNYTSNLGIVLLVFIGYACIGFLDDFLSIRKGNNEGLTTYQKLFMQVKKDKNRAKEFESWKKQAKEKINGMKKGKLTEDEVYEWILKSK